MNIDNVLARAQRMMLDENWNAQVEMGAAAQRAGSLNGRNNGGNDLAAFEAQAFGGSISTPAPSFTPIPEEARQKASRTMISDNGKPIQMLSEKREQVTTANSKLPKSIIESFAAQPPLSGDDDFSTPPASYYSNNSIPSSQMRQPIMEQQYTQQPNTGIDYNALKYIINECIKENLKSLNESATGGLNAFKGMRIGNGSVIQFMDTKGNLYEGKLILKKKATN